MRRSQWVIALLLLVLLEARGEQSVTSESEATGSNTDETDSLPECPYINPVKEMERWDSFDFTTCNITRYQPPKEDEAAEERYVKGEKSFGYNAYISDVIGPRRDLSGSVSPDKHCTKASFDAGKLRANVVIIFHNEAFSVLIRMINSILAETPPPLLRQVILYDDLSEEELRVDQPLKSYIELQKDDLKTKNDEQVRNGWREKVSIHRAEQREGLIRAKVYGSRLIKDATDDDVLIYLDSHCEVTKDWIQPLLAPIREDPTRVMIPVVDLINPYKLDYSKAMIAKGSFDWGLKFNWEYFDWSYFDTPENNVQPFRTIAPSGGLLAINLNFFRQIGEYDTGMEIWGAENVEIAVRTWLCGGSVLTAPCSRVGHIFRMRRPYTGKSGIDTNQYNALRTVDVWFDDYKEQFFNMRPQARKIDAGDLTERIQLKESLKCKPFRWFLENVHPELKPFEPKAKKDRKPGLPVKPKKTEL